MEPLDEILSDWLDETFPPETANALRHYHDCSEQYCKNSVTHYDACGNGYCDYHWDFAVEDVEVDKAA